MERTNKLVKLVLICGACGASSVGIGRNVEHALRSGHRCPMCGERECALELDALGVALSPGFDNANVFCNATPRAEVL